MRTDLIVTYPESDYFLAHVYEHLLGFEIDDKLHDKALFSEISSNAGYIHAWWNKRLKKSDITDFDVLSLPSLDEESVKTVTQVVANEIADNLQTCPAMALRNFQNLSVKHISKLIERKITIQEIRALAEHIVNLEDIVLTTGNHYLIKRRKTPIASPTQSLGRPLIINGLNDKYKQLCFHTSANNVFDGYLICVLGGNIIARLHRAGLKNCFYEVHLDTDKSLCLVINIFSDQETQVLKVIDETIGTTFGGPITTDENLFAPYQIELQRYDYGVVIPPYKLAKASRLLKTFSFKRNGKEISINEPTFYDPNSLTESSLS